MGVAPDTDERLPTVPPRANGDNMDDPDITAGTTVYFPVFVQGALFSIGDAHTVQGHGEVSGSALEAPMRIIYEVNVIKDSHEIKEPQYETDTSYAVTAFATTIDDAAKKATRYMIDYLEDVHNLSREEAYMLCSLAGQLKIAEVVDVPHMLVSMHISKKFLVCMTDKMETDDGVERCYKDIRCRSIFHLMPGWTPGYPRVLKRRHHVIQCG